jgi:hypothetical protein
MSATGKGFINSSDILVSTANSLAVTDIPSNSSIYRIGFVNIDPCHVEIIQHGAVISTAYLEAYDGFEVSENDANIDNIRIVEANIKYKYQGAYEYES